MAIDQRHESLDGEFRTLPPTFLSQRRVRKNDFFF